MSNLEIFVYSVFGAVVVYFFYKLLSSAGEASVRSEQMEAASAG